MSDASDLTVGKCRKDLGNEEVWELIRAMGGATNEEVIDHLYPDFSGSAKEGKRLSQPIYRATSEGAKAGALLESSVANEDTGYDNTRYTYVEEDLRTPRPGNSYKERYIALLAAYEALKAEVIPICRDCSTLLCRTCYTARKKV